MVCWRRYWCFFLATCCLVIAASTYGHAFTILEYKTYPKGGDQDTKSEAGVGQSSSSHEARHPVRAAAEVETAQERDYFGEALASRPLLRLLRSAWHRVRSWQPPGALLRMQPRGQRRASAAAARQMMSRRMARFFRVVDLVDDNLEDSGTSSSVTMNFSLLNVWRTVWSNILDTAAFFIPGLNVTTYASYDGQQSGHGNQQGGLGASADAATAGAVPTQLLPQLDLGDLVGINGTALAFNLAGSLMNLPFVLGPGLGILGLISLLSVRRRGDQFVGCRRNGDSSDLVDCPWYRRYDVLNMLGIGGNGGDGDDDENGDDNDEGGGGGGGEPKTRVRQRNEQQRRNNNKGHAAGGHREDDDDDGDDGPNHVFGDEFDKWLLQAADLDRLPPPPPPSSSQQRPNAKLFKQEPQQQQHGTTRSARKHNNSGELQSGQRSRRKNVPGEHRNARGRETGKRDPIGAAAGAGAESQLQHQRRRPAGTRRPPPPDYVDDIGSWAERPSPQPATTLRPPAGAGAGQGRAETTNGGKTRQQRERTSAGPLLGPNEVNHNDQYAPPDGLKNGRWNIEGYAGEATQTNMEQNAPNGQTGWGNQQQDAGNGGVFGSDQNSISSGYQHDHEQDQASLAENMLMTSGGQQEYRHDYQQYQQQQQQQMPAPVAAAAAEAYRHQQQQLQRTPSAASSSSTDGNGGAAALAGLVMDESTLNRVTTQFQDGYFNYAEHQSVPQHQEAVIGSDPATAAGGGDGYPMTAQQLQLAPSSIGGADPHQAQQQREYFSSQGANSLGYEQSSVNPGGSVYDNQYGYIGEGQQQRQNQHATAGGSSAYSGGHDAAAGIVNAQQQQQQYQQQQQQPASDGLVSAGYTNYGAAILARGGGGGGGDGDSAARPELTAGNQLYSPTYSNSYSVTSSATRQQQGSGGVANSVTAVGPGEGYMASGSAAAAVGSHQQPGFIGTQHHDQQQQYGGDIYPQQQQQLSYNHDTNGQTSSSQQQADPTMSDQQPQQQLGYSHRSFQPYGSSYGGGSYNYPSYG